MIDVVVAAYELERVLFRIVLVLFVGKMTPMISTPSFSNSAWLSETSSIGLPMPPCETMMTLAPRILATRALDKSKTEPTPA